MLGFVCTLDDPYLGSTEKEPNPHFVSTTKFGARIPNDKEYNVLDCRHGRVLLLGKKGAALTALVVWDPMTGCRRELPVPKDYYYFGHVAAVLCAVTGCDHRACHDGPFRVVLAAVHRSLGDCIVAAYVSSPEGCEWSKQCSGLQLEAEWSGPCSGIGLVTQNAFIELMPPVLIQGALYFMLWYDDDDRMEILKYDIGSNCSSLLDGSLAGVQVNIAAILMAMQDGSLGFAHQAGLTLNLWSRPIASDGVATWTQRRVIDLKELLPIQNPKETHRLVGYVEGSDIVFMITDLGIYEINLNSLQWKKIWKRERLSTLFPYMSFYNPRGIFISHLFVF